MKVKTSSKRLVKINEPIKTSLETAEAAEPTTASGRWTSIQRIRLPHKAGLPLSSGGGGDQVSR
jgi:hypothetical protein